MIILLKTVFIGHIKAVSQYVRGPSVFQTSIYYRSKSVNPQENIGSALQIYWSTELAVAGVRAGSKVYLQNVCGLGV